MPVGPDLIERIRRTPRPVTPIPWFMDLDGVLNLIARPPTDDWPEYAQVEVVTDDVRVPGRDPLLGYAHVAADHATDRDSRT